MEKQVNPERVGLKARLEKLADPATPVEERETLAREAFPANRKELLRLGAETPTTQHQPFTENHNQLMASGGILTTSYRRYKIGHALNQLQCFYRLRKFPN